MKQIHMGKEHLTTALDCQRCGGAMRLIGSEPHPIRSRVDLLSFGCTACEALLVLPIEFPANDRTGRTPSTQGATV